MSLQIGLYVASGLLQANAMRQASAAAQAEGQLAQRRIQAQSKMRQLQAIQEHNEIMQNLQSFKSSNAALTGVMGRDSGSDRSLKALRNRAEKDAKKLVNRSNLQRLSDVSRYSQETQMAVLRANNQSKAFRLQAFSSLISTAYGASRLSSGPSSVSPSRMGIYS